jgi:hypothetical protein
MIYILILALNIILLLLIRTGRRFWLVSIPLWVIIFASFVLWRNYQNRKIDRIDMAYWKSADLNKKLNPNNSRGDEAILKELEESTNYVNKFNMPFVHGNFFQTILTFISQIIGFKQTEFKKTYRWTSIIFGLLTLLGFVFEFLIGLPAGGMAG